MVKGKIAKNIGIGLVALASSVLPMKANSEQYKIYNVGTGVGGSIFYPTYISGASDGQDELDGSWSRAPPNPNQKWLKILTNPYGDELQFDCHSETSTTDFQGYMKGVDTTGTSITCPNKFKITKSEGDFDPNMIYTTDIIIYPEFSQDGQEWRTTQNTRTALDVYLTSPGIQNVHNDDIYGDFIFRKKPLQNPQITNIARKPGKLELTANVQPGSYVQAEMAPSADGVYEPIKESEYITPTADNFDSATIPYKIDLYDTETGDNYSKLFRVRAETTDF